MKKAFLHSLKYFDIQKLKKKNCIKITKKKNDYTIYNISY